MATRTKKTENLTKRAIRLLAPQISSKIPGTSTELVSTEAENGWAIKGELALNCNCMVFCPCDMSLGIAPPTFGYCQAWLGVRVDEGHFQGTSLTGQKFAMMLDIPGRMSEGGWTAALYVDESASDAQVSAFETILSGQAGGTTGLLKLLVANFLGTKRVPVTYTVDGKVRTVTAGKAIQASIRPIEGADPDTPVMIENSKYWMAPNIMIAEGLKSRVRDFGRVWNLDGRSAQVVELDWKG